MKCHEPQCPQQTFDGAEGESIGEVERYFQGGGSDDSKGRRGI